MFLAANTLPLVLQSDCKDFGSVQWSVAKTLHPLEGTGNDVNIIHFQSLKTFGQSTSKKVKLDNLKIPQKSGGAIFKTVTR